MSVTCGRICEVMEDIAPEKLAESGDNIGLIIGRRGAEVSKILVSLDATEAVVDEAAALGTEMIISHHPVIYSPVAAITDGDWLGTKVLKIIENRINVFAAHTNLDITDGGTSDVLAELLELDEIEKIIPVESDFAGRAGLLKTPVPLRDFADFVRQRLGMEAIRFYGDESRVIRKVGLCTGSGMGHGSLKETLDAGCDVYVTGDIGYHAAQNAVHSGMCLVDATHFASEIIIVPKLSAYLELRLAGEGVQIFQSKTEKQIFNTICKRL